MKKAGTIAALSLLLSMSTMILSGIDPTDTRLMEQPTIFYAAALAIALAGLGTGLNLYMAWVYTASRIVHSLVHATTNKVLLRFMIFLVGTIALAVMVVNTLLIISG